MSKNTPKFEVTDYFRTFDYLAGLGRWDAIHRIKLADEVAWLGTVTDNEEIEIHDKGDLFGGKKREGGVYGSVFVKFGDDDQVLSEFEAGKYGLTSATCPASRGLMTLMFCKGNDSGDVDQGFYWGTNSPRLPGVKITGERSKCDWYPETARIPQLADVLEGEGSQLTEVPAGDYDLSALPRRERAALDFEGRYWYSITNSTGPAGEDELHKWAMSDHSLVLTLPLDWDGYVSQKIDGIFFENGWIFAEVNDQAGWGSGSSIAVIDPATAELVTTQQAPVSLATSQADYWSCTVDGVVYFIQYGFRGISAWKYEVFSFDGTTWLDLGDINISSSGARFAGLQVLADEFRLYYFDNASGDIRENVVNGAIGPFRTVWSGADAAEEYFYHAGTGSMLMQAGTRMWAVEFYGETFVELWDNPTAFRSSVGTFPHRTASTVVERISYSVALGPSTIDIIDVNSGERVLEMDKGNNSVTNGVFHWDDVGGSLWYQNSSTDLWRWVGETLVSANCFDRNPVHNIYEIATHKKWGLSIPASLIDDADFRAAALTAYNEGIGTAFKWTRSLTGEQLIADNNAVLEAVVFVKPSNGKLSIKLIRRDYDINTLPVLNDDNCEIDNFERKGWGETVSRITVTYTKPENEEEATVTLVDPGTVAMQGRTIGDQKNYYMVRHRNHAIRLAARDLRVGAYPIARCRATISQAQYQEMYPGRVVKVSYTFENGDTITNMAMRISNPSRSHLGNGLIECDLTEDIFALPATEFSVLPPTTSHVKDKAPQPIEFSKIFTLPWHFAKNRIDASIAATAEAAGEVFPGFLAGTTEKGTYGYDVYGQETSNLGTVSFVNFGGNNLVARSLLDVALDAEAETVIADFPDRSVGSPATVGGFVIFGDGTDETSEIGLISAFASGVGYTVKRGVLDTTPKDWPVNTPAWLLPEATDIVDDVQYLPPASVNYKFVTETGLGDLNINLAPTEIGTLTERPYLPLRPADVAASGVEFGSLDATGLANIAMTFAERNRLTEDSVVLSWDDGTVLPEAGQVTVVQALDINQVMIAEDIGTDTATTHSFPVSKWGGADEGYVKVIAELSGKRSLQGHLIHVTFKPLMLLEPGGTGNGNFLLMEGKATKVALEG